jgi:hypothetical protein
VQSSILWCTTVKDNNAILQVHTSSFDGDPAFEFDPGDWEIIPGLGVLYQVKDDDDTDGIIMQHEIARMYITKIK